jgi:hypothetical protein
MILPDTNWAYSELIDLSQQVDPSYDPNKWFQEGGLQQQLTILGQKVRGQNSDLRGRYDKINTFVTQNLGLFATESARPGKFGHAMAQTAKVTFTHWAFGEVLSLSQQVDPSVDRSKMFQPGGLKRQLEGIKKKILEQDPLLRERYERVLSFVTNNPSLFSTSIEGTFTNWAYGEVLALSQQVDLSYDPTTLVQVGELTKQLKAIQKKLSKQDPVFRERFTKVHTFVINNPDLFPTKSDKAEEAGHVKVRTAEKTFTNWAYGELLMLSQELGLDYDPKLWFQERGLELQLEEIERTLPGKGPSLKKRYEKLHTFMTNNPELFSDRTMGAFTNWVYGQVLELSQLVGKKVDPDTLLQPEGLRAQLIVISNTLLERRQGELPEVRLRLEKLRKCVERNPLLFPKEKSQPGVVASGKAMILGWAKADLKSLDGARDEARTNLERSGLDPATLSSLSTLANRLPEFLLKTLQFYCDHPGFAPPRNLQSLFFTFDKKTGAWQLNATGEALMSFLSQNSEWAGTFFETNLLCAFESLRSALRNPTEFLKNAFSGSREERATAITAFIFDNCKLQAPARGCETLLKIFGPWIRSFIQGKIQAALTKFEEPTPSGQPQPPEKQGKASSPTLTQTVPPTIPHEFFSQQFSELKDLDLANTLGETFLDGIPDLALLREARKQDPTPPPKNTVPFVEAMGRVAATLVAQPTGTGEAEAAKISELEDKNLQEKEKLREETESLQKSIVERGQEVDIIRQRMIVELRTKIVSLHEEAIALQKEAFKLRATKYQEADLKQKEADLKLMEVAINQQKMALQKVYQLSQHSVDYPGKCIQAIFSFITNALETPEQCQNTVLAGLIEMGPPPQLNERGRAVHAFLTDRNVQYLSRFLEKNFLQILGKVLSKVQTEQETNPEFLLDTLSTIVGAIQGAIQQAGTAKDAPIDFSGSAVQIMQDIFSTAFPGTDEAQKTWVIGAVRLGTGYLEKNFETIVSGIICTMLARKAPQPASPPEEVQPPGVLELLKNDLQKKGYSKETELSGKIAGLFPGLSLIGNRIARSAAKLFAYAKIPLPKILEAVLTNAPPPERVAEFLLKVTKPEDRYGGPITMKGIAKQKLTALHDEIERQLKEARFAKQPLRTISLAFQWFGVAIGSRIAPGLISSIVGLKGKKALMGYLKSFLGGGLLGGIQIVRPALTGRVTAQ